MILYHYVKRNSIDIGFSIKGRYSSINVKPATRLLSKDFQYPGFLLLKSIPNCWALHSASVEKNRAWK
jgi:hypothetical protein